ncbi:efflux RND transporter periplasmic adaptor subunit [Candidatus Neomarinimicrobiota bacterium]
MSFNKSNIIKILSFFIILTFGFVGMRFLGSSTKQTKKRDVIQEVRKVETQILTHGNIPVIIEGNGTIVAQKTIDIISEVQGIVTFAKNDLKSGTFVNKGEVICKIDKRLAENTFQSQYTEFTRLLTLFLAFAHSESDELHQKWLKYSNGLDINNPIMELPEITNVREKNQAINHKIFTQYLAVKNSEITLSKHIMVAPFSGYITSNGIVKDSYINFGQKIASLQNVTDIEISVPLLLEDAQWIDFNNSPHVKVYWKNDQDSWVSGSIYRKENQLNPNSQSINVFVSLTNNSMNEYLFPGNYVRVLIEGATIPNVAEIPRYIIDNDNNLYFIDDSSRLGRARVNIVSVQGDNLLIERTLRDSTKIVTSILQKPLIGMLIEDVDEVKVEIDSLIAN